MEIYGKTDTINLDNDNREGVFFLYCLASFLTEETIAQLKFDVTSDNRNLFGLEVDSV